MDALLAAVFVGREGGARAVAAEEEAGARAAVPHHFGYVGRVRGQTHLDHAEARAAVYLEHAHVAVFLLPLGEQQQRHRRRRRRHHTHTHKHKQEKQHRVVKCASVNAKFTPQQQQKRMKKSRAEQNFDHTFLTSIFQTAFEYFAWLGVIFQHGTKSTLI